MDEQFKTVILPVSLLMCLGRNPTEYTGALTLEQLPPPCDQAKWELMLAVWRNGRPQEEYERALAAGIRLHNRLAVILKLRDRGGDWEADGEGASNFYVRWCQSATDKEMFFGQWMVYIDDCIDSANGNSGRECKKFAKRTIIDEALAAPATGSTRDRSLTSDERRNEPVSRGARCVPDRDFVLSELRRAEPKIGDTAYHLVELRFFSRGAGKLVSFEQLEEITGLSAKTIRKRLCVYLRRLAILWQDVDWLLPWLSANRE